MRAWILSIAVLVPVVASAQTFTPIYGCFVEQGTASCTQQSIGCSVFSTENLATFGTAVGALCDELIRNTAALINCDATAKSTEANRQEWITYGNKQASLAKKLRRACGKACKKIK